MKNGKQGRIIIIMKTILCKAKKKYEIKIVYNNAFEPEKEETIFSSENLQTTNTVFKLLDKISNKTLIDGSPLFQSIRMSKKLIPLSMLKDPSKGKSKKNHQQTNSQLPEPQQPANSSPAPLPSPDTTHST